MSARIPLRALSELVTDEESDTFALLSSKEQSTTRDGKPYWMVTFRDARIEFTFPIWCDSIWADACREQWTVGVFYKIRAVRRDTKYGPQLEIRRIREVVEQDRGDGFDPMMCLPQSRFPPEELFSRLEALIQTEIKDEPVLNLVRKILTENRPSLLTLPAARSHHHAYVGGWLEHTLSVTETCVFLADKYIKLYPDMDPPLDRDLVIAGAVLHDIGKLRELEYNTTTTEYSAEGTLLGHIVLGRDFIREFAHDVGLTREQQLRLEHLIIAHQRLPEWGSPRPPMTPEALIVHFADDLDAKFHMFWDTLRDDSKEGPLTSDRNPLRHAIFRGHKHRNGGQAD
ncbi:MAG: 3'-5' exoribonuclease YhaM family protein [Thermogutta sp.]